jgi:hypothetical protein
MTVDEKKEKELVKYRNMTDDEFIHELDLYASSALELAALERLFKCCN